MSLRQAATEKDTEYYIALAAEAVKLHCNHHYSDGDDTTLRKIIRNAFAKARAALDAPDITDELATALRDLLRYHDACGVESGTGDAARAVLRRYDDSRKEHA